MPSIWDCPTKLADDIDLRIGILITAYVCHTHGEKKMSSVEGTGELGWRGKVPSFEAGTELALKRPHLMDVIELAVMTHKFFNEFDSS